MHIGHHNLDFPFDDELFPDWGTDSAGNKRSILSVRTDFGQYTSGYSVGLHCEDQSTNHWGDARMATVVLHHYNDGHCRSSGEKSLREWRNKWIDCRYSHFSSTCSLLFGRRTSRCVIGLNEWRISILSDYHSQTDKINSLRFSVSFSHTLKLSKSVFYGRWSDCGVHSEMSVIITFILTFSLSYSHSWGFLNILQVTDESHNSERRFSLRSILLHHHCHARMDGHSDASEPLLSYYLEYSFRTIATTFQFCAFFFVILELMTKNKENHEKEK